MGFQGFIHALRRLARSPGFALSAILTLALGIAASTAIFSVAYAALVDPLQLKDPATLVTITWCSSVGKNCRGPGYPPALVAEISSRADVFAGAMASSVSDVARTDTDHAEILRVGYLTENALSVLGARPLLGRLPTAEDVRSDAQPVVVLSYRYWKNRLGADRNAVGGVLILNGKPRVLIGVLPPRFLWLGADAYLPIQLGLNKVIEGQGSFVFWGRLKHDVSAGDARIRLQQVFEGLARSTPEFFELGGRIELRTLQQMERAGIEDALALLAGGALVLLLIACVNVSGLLLARTIGQDREIAIRVALGASRWQLMRQVLADAFVLVLCALPLGVALAYYSLRAITAIIPQGYLPPEPDVSINLPFLVAALALSLLAVVVSCIGPGWHLARASLVRGFGDVLRANSVRPVQAWTMAGLVIAEITFSLVLLTVASLFLHSSLKLRSVTFAFKPEDILTARVPLPNQRYPEKASRNRLIRDLLERVRRIPRVSSVVTDVALPFFEFWSSNVRTPGNSPSERWSILHATNVDYFSMFGLTLVRGRPFTEAEVDDGRRVLVVNREFARIFLNGRDPIGHTVHLTGVGLTEDSRATLTVDKYPQAFIPYTTLGMSEVLAVRTAEPGLVAPSIRQIVHSLDNELGLAGVQTMDAALVEQGYAAPRFQTTLFTIFAASGLLLMAVAVYGMIASNVARRKKEIAIRLSLGAQRPAVLWMVLRRALMLGAAGAALGVPLSLATSHFAQFALYATAWNDPFVLGIAIVILLGVVSFAAFLPARHAARTDPMQNLREE